jgi:hypothetical protein
MATDKISSPLDRLVDENNKKNLKISRKHSKDVYIWCYIQVRQYFHQKIEKNSKTKNKITNEKIKLTLILILITISFQAQKFLGKILDENNNPISK